MKNILIIGMGEFGKHLAYRLKDLNSQVCIVDKDADTIDLLANDFENAYVADCMQELALKDLGVRNFDTCVVAVGHDFRASLEITSKLKDLKAKHIISKASSDLQAKFLIMAGANDTIYPEKDSAYKTAIKCTANNLLDVFSVQDDYTVFEMNVLKEWHYKSLKTLNIRTKYNVNIIAVKKGNKMMVPDADYVFEPNDSVLVFGKTSSFKKLKQI